MWYVQVKFTDEDWTRWYMGKSHGIGFLSEESAMVELVEAVFELPSVKFRVVKS